MPIKKTALALGVTAFGAVFAAFLVFTGSYFSRNSTDDENAYERMRSFSCVLNTDRNLLQLDWRNDTAAARTPGWEEGAGDRIILQFKPVNETVNSLGTSTSSSVEISQSGSLRVSLAGRPIAVNRLFLSLLTNGKREVRDPNTAEMVSIAADVKRYLPFCLEEQNTEFEINK